MAEKGTKTGALGGKPAKGLRMKELIQATGLPKSTILHYVAEGLLPEPVRTSRNMAYYDPGCAERARDIKAIQTTYAFPLAKIKKLLSLRDQGRDIAPFVELNEAVFGKAGGPALDEAAFRQATGLTQPQVSALLSARLLMPLEEGSFNREDVAAGRAYAGAFAFGLGASDLAFYVAAAKNLVDHEMELRQRLTRHLPDEQDAVVTRQLTEGARALRDYVFDRVFQHRIMAASGLKDERLLT
jgi:DNA-binding transcriptional MerR regulator